MVRFVQKQLGEIKTVMGFVKGWNFKQSEKGRPDISERGNSMNELPIIK